MKKQLTILMASLLMALTLATAATAQNRREPQPGDDRGGKNCRVDNRGNRVCEPEPGDDRGGNRGINRREPQPGDDRGGHGRHGLIQTLLQMLGIG
ncbi:MAG TPA: hypothetical protein PLD20_14655 [Blastocatellia bacterium]|nr:hypothetical protein [Blastocatellia bacterium]HMV87551.1 hypothetical protein [Blastocatellia bacterium]HMX26071.1 hypothetical protein [Blastocatellia bacterium]HMY71358.1 hypothetical protein [Blastocatellia bacterium]HMZ19172.1 hypothetical protein [Blastocatellia bacterium]